MEQQNALDLKAESVKKSFDQLKKEETILSEKLKEKEMRHKEIMDKKQEELDECEKNLAEAKKFINGTSEDDLAAEINELEDKQKELNRKLRENDEDGESSISGFSYDCVGAMPIIEKITDMETYFKNPNDFPNLLNRISSPARSPVVQAQKRKRSAESSPKSSRNESPSPQKKDRHLKPKNSDESDDQKKKSSSHRRSSQKFSPNVSPRHLRSKRKSQEKLSEIPVKVARVDAENIAQAPKKKISEKSKRKSQETCNEVGPSEPVPAEIQPMVKELVQPMKKVEKKKEIQKKDVEVQEKLPAVAPPPEDPRDPAKDGQKQPQFTDEISIPETPTTEEIEAKAADKKIEGNPIEAGNDNEEMDDEEDEPGVFRLVRFCLFQKI